MAQRFGPFVLDADAGLLTREGVPVPVGYRGLVLLDVLVRSAGRTVGKAELLDAAWPSLAVEESNLTVQMSALRRLLGVQPDGGDWIVTVPRVGYRFAGAEFLHTIVAKGVDDSRPTIAVLPFASLSEDPEQSYFAEGLTDDIVARLARLTWLNITARAFATGHRSGEAGRNLRDLGVRYVLEGSVRRSGDGMRIVCLLSEAESGRQVWTDTRNVHVSDFLTLQDAIAEAVIAAIEPRLYAVEYEHVRARPPESLDAWGLVVKAMPAVWTWGTVESIVQAEALLERAIRLEPDYARANSLLAWARAARFHLGAARMEDVIPVALASAARAVQRDPEDAWTHLAMGYVAVVGRDTVSARPALSESIALNPSLAIAHMILGCALGYGGDGEGGLAALAKSEALSPRDFAQPALYATYGLCHLIEGRFDQAVDFERRAIALRPHFGTAWRTLAASAGLADDLVTARQAIARCLELQPGLSCAWVEAYHPIVRAEDRARYVEGLRRGGLR